MDHYPVWQNNGVVPCEAGHIGPLPTEAREAIAEWLRSGAHIPEGCTEVVFFQAKETHHIYTCPRSVDTAGFPLDI